MRIFIEYFVCGKSELLEQQIFSHLFERLSNMLCLLAHKYFSMNDNTDFFLVLSLKQGDKYQLIALRHMLVNTRIGVSEPRCHARSPALVYIR